MYAMENGDIFIWSKSDLSIIVKGAKGGNVGLAWQVSS